MASLRGQGPGEEGTQWGAGFSGVSPPPHTPRSLSGSPHLSLSEHRASGWCVQAHGAPWCSVSWDSPWVGMGCRQQRKKLCGDVSPGGVEGRESAILRQCLSSQPWNSFLFAIKALKRAEGGLGLTENGWVSGQGQLQGGAGHSSGSATCSAPCATAELPFSLCGLLGLAREPPLGAFTCPTPFPLGRKCAGCWRRKGTSVCMQACVHACVRIHVCAR